MGAWWEGKLGVGKPEDLPIMKDGGAITPSGDGFVPTRMGFFIGAWIPPE